MKPIIDKSKVVNSGLTPILNKIPYDGMNGFRTTLIRASIEAKKSGLFAVAVKAGSDKAKQIGFSKDT